MQLKLGTDYNLIHKRGEVLGLPPSFYSSFQNSIDNNFVDYIQQDIINFVKDGKMKLFLFTSLDKKELYAYCTVILKTIVKRDFTGKHQISSGIDFHKNTLHIEHFAKNTNASYSVSNAISFMHAVFGWGKLECLSPVITCTPLNSSLSKYYVSKMGFHEMSTKKDKMLIRKL